MLNATLSEEEIEAAEDLCAQGKFNTSLAIKQKMLNRTQNNETRMRLLFGILFCSTQLDLKDVTDNAIRALEQLPSCIVPGIGGLDRE